MAEKTDFPILDDTIGSDDPSSANKHKRRRS
jgi:hypothetical protein